MVFASCEDQQVTRLDWVAVQQPVTAHCEEGWASRESHDDPQSRHYGPQFESCLEDESDDFESTRAAAGLEQ